MKQNIFTKEFAPADYMRMASRTAKISCAVSLILIILSCLFAVEVSPRAILLTSAAAVILDLVLTALIGARHGKAL